MMRKTIRLSIIAMLLLLIGCSPKIKLFPDGTDPLEEYTLSGDGANKVLLIPFRGAISSKPRSGTFTSSPSLVQEVVSQLRKAEQDRRIKAVLLQINSPGGTVTASDMLYHEIKAYKARTGVKIVVVMMDVAASGAYYISLPADHILAHPTTITGSVGVISVRPKIPGLLEKVGVEMEVQKSGVNKDMGSPFRETTGEEKEILQKLIDDLALRFQDLVKTHRGLDAGQMEKISTARIFLPQEALALGLVDEIGYLSDAEARAKHLAGIGDNARLVVYRRSEVANDTVYNAAAGKAAATGPSLINLEWPVGISDLDTGFHYMWIPGLDRG